MARSKSALRLVVTLALGLGCGVLPPAAAQSTSTFPVKLSSNERYLLDGSGNPFMVVGDSAWYIVQQLTKTQTDQYLENRRLKGFNAIIVEMITTVPNQPTLTRNGDAPFTTPGDFSTPNENYFAQIDYVVSKANEKGILCFLAPCWWGSGGSEWWNTIIANGATKCRNYGQYLGSRYKNSPNIIWVHGGDYDAPSGSTGELNSLQILLGILDRDTSKIHTMHRARYSTALQQTNFAPYFDMDATYSGDWSYQESLTAYNHLNYRPTCLIEGRYEGYEDWNNNKYNPPELVRACAYGPVLCGSTGQIFGSNYVYDFGYSGYDWVAGMDRQGSQDMTRLRAVFGSRAWYRLVPDQGHALVTSGYGTSGGTDYIPAAATTDGTLAMAYVSSTGVGARSLTVNMTKLAGSTSAKWYNPTNGTYSTVSGSPFPNSGSRSFSTPGDNGTGTNDWVLVLESAPLSGGTYSVSANPTSVAAGAAVNVGVSESAPGNSHDWVGLYSAASPVEDGTWTNLLDWKYLNNTMTAPASPELSATIGFTMPAVAGSYQFRLFWNDGAQLLATSNTVSVGAASNQAPQVSLSSPVPGAVYSAGSDVSVTATATDADGSVANVKLYLNGQLVRQENFAPYEWGMVGQNDAMLAGMAAGTYELSAVATDNQGATATSAVVTFTVNGVVTGGAGSAAGSSSGHAGGGGGGCGLTGLEALFLFVAWGRRNSRRIVSTKR